MSNCFTAPDSQSPVQSVCETWLLDKQCVSRGALCHCQAMTDLFSMPHKGALLKSNCRGHKSMAQPWPRTKSASNFTCVRLALSSCWWQQILGSRRKKRAKASRRWPLELQQPPSATQNEGLKTMILRDS